MRFRLKFLLSAVSTAVLVLGALGGLELAVAGASHRTADVAYVPTTESGFDATRHRLDVYAPRTPAPLRPIVVFIHGGSWNSGRKDTYRFIGRRLAQQGYVGVVINYRLSPAVQVPAMADDCARAVLWTQQHTAEYGGDPARIYLIGHSAGGGLAALLATNDSLFSQYGQPINPVRGVVLDDAAGLNMYTYLQKLDYEGDEQYLVPFGPDPAGWRQNSAYFHLRPGQPRFIIFLGGETYPSIKKVGHEFQRRLAQVGNPAELIVINGRHHVPMVLQLYFRNNIIYRKLRELAGT
ncbi:MAG: alpha/beta hydrolase [Hymenobacteraceae bacterium]|nr:alpha/beta hydrolase [Hymenobacteraceae bacterium]